MVDYNTPGFRPVWWDHIPEAGAMLSHKDFDNLMELLHIRKDKFPNEELRVSLGVILFNLGDAFTHVICFGGEWHGYKFNLQSGEGIPTCPNGHVLMADRPGLTLGWVENKEP